MSTQSKKYIPIPNKDRYANMLLYNDAQCSNYKFIRSRKKPNDIYNDFT